MDKIGKIKAKVIFSIFYFLFALKGTKALLTYIAFFTVTFLCFTSLDGHDELNKELSPHFASNAKCIN